MPADSSNLVVSPHFLESGSIYVYKRDFDAYFCSVGRVYVKKDTMCQCINESGTLFFFGSKNTLPSITPGHISLWENDRGLQNER